jgi:hypothetical protein
MARSIKKSKKKASIKASTTNDDTRSPLTRKTQDKPTQILRQESEQEWTPLQQEQIDLAKKLDSYISEFQKKLLRLNFTPSPRELVILFIMNLHPRWRRLVEPVELSCSSWVEAAAFARLHCARVSAILGCEQNDADTIFKSPETRALRDSGYFAPESSPIAQQQQEQRKNTNVSDIMSSQEQHLVEKIISYREKSPPKPTTTTSALPEPSSEVSSSFSTPPQTATKQPSVDPVETKESSANVTAKIEPETKKVEVKETKNVKEPSTAEPVTIASNSTSSSASSPPITKAKVQQAANKTKKGKEKSVTMLQYERPFTATVDHEDPNSHSHSICNRVPPEYAEVNLAFLELTINEKKVKGLLAKQSWGSSAMSLGCVNRLGLSMRKSDNFGINTNFGYADSIGFLTLPIVHPADPNTKSEMEIQVLPQIYGGKIDLVLGADFFHYHNPTLNIRTRAIRFLEKETPYIVGQIE